MSISARELIPNPAYDPAYARRVQEAAASRGLSTNLASRIYMQTADVDEVMWVLDADDLPALTLDEQSKSAELGLGIATSRTGADALLSIQNYLITGERLWILSPSIDVGDWSPLVTASELQVLITNGEPSLIVDLTRLSKLRHLAIEGSNWQLDWSSSRLKVLLISGVKATELPAVGAPIEFLSVSAGRGLTDLSAFADLSELRTLFVTGAGVFNAGELSAAGGLSGVVFDDCLGVNRVDVFAAMPGLLRLTFDNVRTVHPAESLEKIGVEIFEVFGNYSFDDRFTVPGPNAMVWRVPPLRPAPASRSSWLLSKHSFEVTSAGDEVLVSFSDWNIAKRRAKSVGARTAFDSSQIETVFRFILKKKSASGPEFDSEGDRVVFVVKSIGTADAVVSALTAGWNDDVMAAEAFAAAFCK